MVQDVEWGVSANLDTLSNPNPFISGQESKFLRRKWSINWFVGHQAHLNSGGYLILSSGASTLRTQLASWILFKRDTVFSGRRVSEALRLLLFSSSVSEDSNDLTPSFRVLAQRCWAPLMG